jgi:hypothetical protein
MSTFVCGRVFASQAWRQLGIGDRKMTGTNDPYDEVTDYLSDCLYRTGRDEELPLETLTIINANLDADAGLNEECD